MTIIGVNNNEMNNPWGNYKNAVWAFEHDGDEPLSSNGTYYLLPKEESKASLVVAKHQELMACWWEPNQSPERREKMAEREKEIQEWLKEHTTPFEV